MRLNMNSKRLSCEDSHCDYRKSWWIGMVTTLALAICILCFTYWTSERYRSANMPHLDGALNFANVAIILQNAKTHGLFHALHDLVPFRVPGFWTEHHVLYKLMSAVLAPVLPLRESSAVILNGIWYVAMAGTAYCLFWRYSRSWAFSVAGVTLLLTSRPLLSRHIKGLTDLDPTVLAYMLGATSMCWILLSDGLRRPLAAVMAGIFLGLLALGRCYALVLVAAAMAPYVAWALLQGHWPERRATLVGLLLCGGCFLLVAGWWLFPNFKLIHHYPSQFFWQRPCRDVTVSVVKEWVKFALVPLYHGAPIVVILGWRFVLQCDSAKGLLDFRRRFHWLYLWMALAPLAVLIAMGCYYPNYGWPVMLGVYLTLAFPLQATTNAEGPRLGPSRRCAIALVGAAGVLIAVFLHSLFQTHSHRVLPKDTPLQALAAIRAHAAETGQDRITVGMAHWGWGFNGACLVNLCVYDLGCRIEMDDSSPNLPVASGRGLVVVPLPNDLWAWDDRVSGSQTVTPESCVDQMTRRADYVIVSGEPVQQEPKPRLEAQPWREASRRLRESKEFQPIFGPVSIKIDGRILVLARVHEHQ